jgi:Domain of Unknown Function (DUF1206)
MTSTYTGETGSQAVENVARRHPGVVTLGRLGWVAKGLVYGVFGALAVKIAIDATGRDQGNTAEQEASQTGAVAEIADTSFGEIALYVVAAGLILYALWRLISVVLPAENSATTWLTRLGYLVSAVVYTVLAWTALSFARHKASSSGTQGEDAKVERFTRELMEKSGGRWLVGALGVVIIAVGIYFAIKGLQAKFRDELEPRGVGPIRHESIVTLGRVGWVGRAVVMGLVGWLLIRAAVRFRPDEAKGFDGALREVTDSGFGVALVWFAAIALVVYGLFCVISAPRQRLKGAD